MSRYGHNKVKLHREVKKKSVIPKNPDIKPGIYSSFDIDTSSSENDKLEIRTN